MSLTGTDGGYMAVHNITRPKARKSYRCDECDGTIEPGEVYRRDFMVWEGEPESAVTCASCDELMRKFFEAIPKDYRHELTFFAGGLRAAVIELRNEFGATIEGFDYPPAEVINLKPKGEQP